MNGPTMKTPNPYRVLKAAIALWAIAVVVALCLMMVFGETLG